MKVPVVIYHCGQAEYLKTALKSAADFNENVVLLGNDANRDYCRNWVNVHALDHTRYEKFKKAYKLMASYDPAFDLIMFEKYFVFSEWMKKNKVKKAFLLDSDLLTYCDFDQFDFVNTAYAALSIPKIQEPYIWAASPHVSFWTMDAIDDFCDFVVDMYENHLEKLEEKYAYHLEKKVPGGVCDMTLLYLWSVNKENVYNTAVWNQNGVFEHCMGISKNYVDGDFLMNKFTGVKMLEYKSGVPYLKASNGLYIRAWVLHFQGLAKGVMADYYYGRYYRIIFDRFAFVYKKGKAKLKKMIQR